MQQPQRALGLAVTSLLAGTGLAFLGPAWAAPSPRAPRPVALDALDRQLFQGADLAQAWGRCQVLFGQPTRHQMLGEGMHLYGWLPQAKAYPSLGLSLGDGPPDHHDSVEALVLDGQLRQLSLLSEGALALKGPLPPLSQPLSSALGPGWLVQRDPHQRHRLLRHRDGRLAAWQLGAGPTPHEATGMLLAWWQAQRERPRATQPQAGQPQSAYALVRALAHTEVLVEGTVSKMRPGSGTFTEVVVALPPGVGSDDRAVEGGRPAEPEGFTLDAWVGPEVAPKLVVGRSVWLCGKLAFLDPSSKWGTVLRKLRVVSASAPSKTHLFSHQGRP